MSAAVAGLRSRASGLPSWAWLTGIVLVSAAIRIALSHRIVAPWIMSDELVYSELAKSFAAHGSFSLRGVPSNGYGFVYPAVIAPAWRLFSAMPQVYAAAKVINSVAMSLAAVPAYFLARRLLRPGLALGVAALTVLVPSMLYTGMLMTENVFYPIFLMVALGLVAMLEQPTPFRQVLMLALCLVAYLTRAQAVALVAAAASAPIVLVFVERRGLRGLRAFSTLYGILVAGVALALLDTLARGRSIYSLLGAYRAATDSTYTVDGVLHYLLYHVAELDLSLGIIPFAALVALWLAPREGPLGARAFAVASLAIVPWLVLEVAAFASEQSQRIEERNMFYVAPLALIALLSLAQDGVVTRRRRPLLIAAAIAAVLPFFIPFARFIGPPVVSDTFGLMPWWWVQDQGIHFDNLRWVVLAVSVLAAGLFAFLPRRLALVLPVLIAAFFVASSYVVENGRHGIRRATLNSSFAGITVAHPDWIDRIVGHNARVDYLWDGVNSYTVWEPEFFNRSFRRVYTTGGPGSDVLPETAVTVQPDGRVVAGTTPVRAEYVLTDGSNDVRGKPIGGDPRSALQLFRVDGPIVVLTRVTGLYPNDTWSGKTGRRVTYRRLDCNGGRLTASLGSDPAIYKSLQTVVATSRNVVRTATIAPTGQATLTVPLGPTPGTHTCVVDFETARTLIPARVNPKTSTDPRPLGAHFLTFSYQP